ncbi:MAG: hypothetical protein HEQ39_17870 [Rhizobacter sp.]
MSPEPACLLRNHGRVSADAVCGKLGRTFPQHCQQFAERKQGNPKNLLRSNSSLFYLHRKVCTTLSAKNPQAVDALNRSFRHRRKPA